MRTPIYENVLANLQSMKGRWPQVAEATGISIRTLRKIASREIEDPGISHVERLHNYFAEKAGSV